MGEEKVCGLFLDHLLQFASSPTSKKGGIVNSAAERNKEPILQILKLYIKPPAEQNKRQKLLEISSGSGQHVAYLAPQFPFVDFQPTEYEKQLLPSIEAYRNHAGVTNIKPAQYLNVNDYTKLWADSSITPNSLDYILNINMMHISPWACSASLFVGSAETLKPGGYLFTYGPYAMDGKLSPESNISFDAGLRRTDPSWGIRDITQQLVPLAKGLELHLLNIHDLPANNKLLVWQKKQI